MSEQPPAGTPAPRRRGRRAGGGSSRDDILASARELFLTEGYDRVSLRAVARHAGVDPALVHHWFDGKPELFVASVVAEDVNPVRHLDAIVDADPATIGQTVVRTFLGVWDPQESRGTFASVMQLVSSPDQAVSPFREFVAAEILRRLPVAATTADDADRRAELVASQLLGLGVARYVIRLPRVADATPDELAAWIGPTIQRYLMAE